MVSLLMIAFHLFTFSDCQHQGTRGSWTITHQHCPPIASPCTLQHSPFELAQPLLQASSLVLLSWLGQIQNPAAQLPAGEVVRSPCQEVQRISDNGKTEQCPPSVNLLAESEMDAGFAAAGLRELKEAACQSHCQPAVFLCWLVSPQIQHATQLSASREVQEPFQF
jgi:hypothetical protein